MLIARLNPLVYLTWMLLLSAAAYCLLTARWGMAFQAAYTLVATFVPVLLPRLVQIELPNGLIAAITLFLCGTMFLGETLNFYERFWWWDLVMHGGSAVLFSVGGLIVLLVFIHERTLSAVSLVTALYCFTFAVSIGVVWEIFEFTMDQTFGTNMQKSGLLDTMGDLIVDCIGAAIGAALAYIYLQGINAQGPVAWIREFRLRNRRLFRG